MIQTYFNDTFTRVRYQTNNRGQIELEQSETYKGRVERDKRINVGIDGEDLFSSARIFAYYQDDIRQGDRIYFGHSEELTGLTGEEIANRTFPVIRIIPQRGFQNSHLEVYVG